MKYKIVLHFRGIKMFFFYKKITTFINILSSLAYGGDLIALFGTGKPDFVLRNSCDIKSLVGVP